METTFITIHDLSLDARIRYASDSIEDILGYLPDDVISRSCWDFFHPEEVPFAKASHGRGIELDKAAALFYCKVKHKDGSFVGCECVFTVVYDVLVASTSVYRRGPRSAQRQIQAPAVQRLFSSSPRDSRYHMLSYISSKFSQAPTSSASHEPRAALFLNRFTRTSTIMYATSGVFDILGVGPDQLINKSFYHCIAEECLQNAVGCLENAKSNDSIAYLRFWFQDPAVEERPRAAYRTPSRSSGEDEDEDEDDDYGGVSLQQHDQAIANAYQNKNGARFRSRPENTREDLSVSRSTSDTSTDRGRNESSSGTGFDNSSTDQSPSSTIASPDEQPTKFQPIEIEAVVSCSSDGLVVVVRRARPAFPNPFDQGSPVEYQNGLFASPWAVAPIASHANPEVQAINGENSLPSATVKSMGMTTPGPETSTVMAAIRDVAVFAWSLTGINGSLAQHGRGQPEGEALPPGGLPVWDPSTDHAENDQYNGFADNSHRRTEPEPSEHSSSEDEVVYKRSTTMPEYKRPPRRGHRDAFSPDDLKEAENGSTPTRKRKVQR